MKVLYVYDCDEPRVHTCFISKKTLIREGKNSDRNSEIKLKNKEISAKQAFLAEKSGVKDIVRGMKIKELLNKASKSKVNLPLDILSYKDFENFFHF